MISIRRTLTLRLLAVLGILTLAAAGGLFWGIRAALTRQFDETLQARLDSLQNAARWDGEHFDLDIAQDSMPWYQPGRHAEYFEFIRADAPDAPALAASPSLGRASLARPEGAKAANVPLPDRRRGRVLARRFTPIPDEELDAPGKEQKKSAAVASAPQTIVVVAMSRQPLDSTLGTIGGALAIACLAGMLGLIGAVRFALGRGLAPLDHVSDQVRHIDANSLTERISAEDSPLELRPVCERLNELLARLEDAFARERRFASAAAHELRTPVAELRTLLEVALSRPRTTGEMHATMSEALDIANRAEHLVVFLLALAHPSRTPRRVFGPVEIGPILEQAVRRHAPRAAARSGSITVDCHEEFVARADETALTSILENLLTNAVDHAAPPPIVQCRVCRDGPWIKIEISNPVANLAPEQLPLLFEPFWRSETARSAGQHVGLGLSVARTLASELNGQLTAELGSPTSLTLCLRLGSLASGHAAHDMPERSACSAVHSG